MEMYGIDYETRARPLVILDGRTARNEMRRYLNSNDGPVARLIRALWDEQREIITIETTKTALDNSAIPDDWTTPWERMIREYVRDSMIPAWLEAIKTGGERIEKNVNALQQKAFGHDTTMASVKAWIDKEGGRLITNLTKAQFGSVQAMLLDQIALGVTSPYILSQRLRPMCGLTINQAKALSKKIAILMEEGLSASALSKQTERTAAFYHKQRAIRIARTEMSNAYNFGQLNSMKQAAAEGWLPGIPEKGWIAGGADPCDICLDNEAGGYVDQDSTFPSGDEAPTAHPNCACSVGYRVRR